MIRVDELMSYELTSYLFNKTKSFARRAPVSAVVTADSCSAAACLQQDD